ncbi:MAG: hypothetical protein ACHREM_03505 [Polyangiales bacterium]
MDDAAVAFVEAPAMTAAPPAILTLFPALAARVSPSAQAFERRMVNCVIAGVATVDVDQACAWVLSGSGPRSSAEGDRFVAALRARQTEEVVIIMRRSAQSFDFLEKCSSPWTDVLPDARSALDDALARWDRGEDVRYVHGFR